MHLSRLASCISRHNPHEFWLESDSHGFVAVQDILVVLRNQCGELDVSDLKKTLMSPAKRRFKIQGEKTRDRYGRSIDVMLDTPCCRPHEFLFDGTGLAMEDSSQKEGVEPMQRKYVHLSKITDKACQVGHRKSKNPVVFTVRAREAHEY